MLKVQSTQTDSATAYQFTQAGVQSFSDSTLLNLSTAALGSCHALQHSALPD